MSVPIGTPPKKGPTGEGGRWSCCCRSTAPQSRRCRRWKEPALTRQEGHGRRCREESADPEVEPSPTAQRQRARPWPLPPSSREMRRQSIRPGMSTSAADSAPPALDP
ncbi:unnamed protein product [Urochloa humidicola]